MRPVLATMRAAMTEAAANQSAFWSQLAAMFVNDVAWITFWLLFFHRVGTLRDWHRSDVLMLMAVLTVGGGLVLGLLSNARRIGQLVADGGLDAVLALPVHPLPALLVRRVDPTNIGDVLFGLVLFAAAGRPSPARLAMFVAVCGLGAVVLVSFLVFTGSLAFFAGCEVGDFGFNAMLMLAAYPVNVFSGAARAMVYVVVPAAFVAAVPARLIAHPNAGELLVLVAAAGVAALTAWATFTIGLRRYTGSAIWTSA